MPRWGILNRAMPQSLSAVYIHLVFSTKDRRPLLRDKPTRDALHSYLGGVSKQIDCAPIQIGGVEDHVHLLVSLKTTDAPAELVRELKKATSVWAAERHEPLFAWQEGDSILSVSWTHVPVVRRYIANQDSHHRKIPFVDELKRLLEKNGVKYDPKYLL